MDLNDFVVFAFQQKAVLAKSYDDRTADKGVCAGLVIRFAQLYYLGVRVTEDLMTNNVYYAKLVQDKFDEKFKEGVREHDVYAEFKALTGVSPYTGFIAKANAADPNVEKTLAVSTSAPGRAHYIVLNFAKGGAHAVGIAVNPDKSWQVFDPNLEYFEGETHEGLTEFFTSLSKLYAQLQHTVSEWENISLIKHPGFPTLMSFLKSKGLE
ncbi:YopT-type cysteine protease domain-containing protein [Denitrobaculum tricleocarpae]|uniref:Peptidase C58 YopT-type domain-containing protein n=1 Tax=Denitrobaculum tricleocarpae TaxID=2591009 RepID=A0A545T3Y1_9PROT|nr:YopT-type cysteine protease domain-containing protein [Denitrobaculum tricleocarpae]TQV71927.1 hypothetical protein FKG95_26490 [Denitrobaculum tricleocarpae]